MRVALALEGLLVDVDSAFAIRKSRQGGASSYMETSVLNDESFWASLELKQDIGVLQSVDVVILTQRPKKLFLITRSWLRRHGVEIDDENIIMQSSGGLKRYDCRLYGIDYFIDSDVETLSSFRYDRCIPIGVGTGFPDWIESFPDLASVRFNESLRDWKCLDDEALC